MVLSTRSPRDAAQATSLKKRYMESADWLSKDRRHADDNNYREVRAIISNMLRPTISHARLIAAHAAGVIWRVTWLFTRRRRRTSEPGRHRCGAWLLPHPRLCLSLTQAADPKTEAVARLAQGQRPRE
jgi:hypothetical protein